MKPGQRRFEGRVVELELVASDDEAPGKVEQAIVELFEEPSGPIWIAVWTPEQWRDHPNGTPARGDDVVLVTRAGPGGYQHEIQWHPRKIEPWSDELLARLRAQAD